MSKYKIDLDIPFDVQNDLVYCQRALANHILIHQKISSDSESLVPSDRRPKYLRQLEQEIISIGSEQKNLFNRLRLLIDYFIAANKTNGTSQLNRKTITDYVSEQITKYANSCDKNDILPITVLSRMEKDDLFNKYILNIQTSEANDIVTIRDSDSDDDDIQEVLNHKKNGKTKFKNDELNGEVLEVLVSPEDITDSLQSVYQQPYYQNQQQLNQESLLKPKAERLPVVKEEKKPGPITDAEQKINLIRLKLKQALTKAKNENDIKLATPQKLVTKPKIKSVSPETTTSSSSSSQSSNASADNLSDLVELSDDKEPTVLGKEAFLRLFGLYTHTYSDFLKTRRTARKRRNCTSTERIDFHYGRFDLFEKQYANKRNKQQFLYSPPATRAKRQRRAQSTVERISTRGSIVQITRPQTSTASNTNRSKGIKSNTSSSSSLSSNASLSSAKSTNNSGEEKVCMTCFRKNNLLCCKICLGTYHTNCHLPGLKEQAAKEQICPYCFRQKSRKNNDRGNRITSVAIVCRNKRKEALASTNFSLMDVIVCD